MNDVIAKSISDEGMMGKEMEGVKEGLDPLIEGFAEKANQCIETLRGSNGDNDEEIES